MIRNAPEEWEQEIKVKKELPLWWKILGWIMAIFVLITNAGLAYYSLRYVPAASPVFVLSTILSIDYVLNIKKRPPAKNWKKLP